MKRYSTRSARPRRLLAERALVIALVPTLLALGACVTRGTYEGVVSERNQLRAKTRQLETSVDHLETSSRSLDGENAKLHDQLEDLRLERKRLRSEVERLTGTQERLAQDLEARNAELAEVAKLKGTYANLVADLEAEVATGQIVIQQLQEGLQVNVADDVLFPSGSARLDRGGEEVLEKVAVRLAELPHDIEVDGHTDNIPISGALVNRYPTNWELGAARAARVVRLLQERGIDGERLSAVSHAEFQPLAANDSPEERAQNRRIEIRLLPRDKTSVDADVSGLVGR